MLWMDHQSDLLALCIGLGNLPGLHLNNANMCRDTFLYLTRGKTYEMVKLAYQQKIAAILGTDKNLLVVVMGGSR